MEECLTVNGLCKSFDTLEVLDHLDLHVSKGERLAFLGPSGAGKTTFLRIISGLEPISSGSIQCRYQKFGFVFQEPRLIPWQSLKGNLLFVNPDGDYSSVLSQVGLTGFEDYLPHQLSGGMRQRVNLARALMIDPEILILDEAFYSLDLKVKLMIMEKLIQHWEKEHFTLISVTHDPKEAIYLADRILLLSKRPAKIYKEFQVDLPHHRDFSSTEFMNLESALIGQISNSE